jgi:hypothetical protein
MNLESFFDGSEGKHLGNAEAWQDEWIGMPEFIQEKNDCYHKIIVRFDNFDDLVEFGKLINQKINPTTKSIWHPSLDRGVNSSKLYIDEDES